MFAGMDTIALLLAELRRPSPVDALFLEARRRSLELLELTQGDLERAVALELRRGPVERRATLRGGRATGGSAAGQAGLGSD